MTAQRRKSVFILYWTLTTILAFSTAVSWYLSPLGLGFERWPVGEPLRSTAFDFYNASYFIGIPALILSQIASLALVWIGRRRLAFALPAVSLGSEIACIAIVLVLAG